jgi:hypothetical protein
VPEPIAYQRAHIVAAAKPIAMKTSAAMKKTATLGTDWSLVLVADVTENGATPQSKAPLRRRGLDGRRIRWFPSSTRNDEQHLVRGAVGGVDPKTSTPVRVDESFNQTRARAAGVDVQRPVMPRGRRWDQQPQPIPAEQQPWCGNDLGRSTYKIGDPVLFSGAERFRPVIFTNLKGWIVAIERVRGQIRFDVELDRPLSEFDVDGDELEWLEGSTIRFSVYEHDISDDDDDSLNTTVPFQVAYAVSIHKAQGLEYDSVKIVHSSTVAIVSKPSTNSGQIDAVTASAPKRTANSRPWRYEAYAAPSATSPVQAH